MAELVKSNTNSQYLSLAQLTQQLGVYEATPVPIQGWLKRGFQIALLINLILLPFLDWLWGWLPQSGSISFSSEYFLFPVTSQILNWLLALAQKALAPLIYLNLASTALAIPVLLVSRGLTRPVAQPFHWLAWLAAFPAGLSAAAALLIAGFMIFCAGLDWTIALIAFIVIIVFCIIAIIAVTVFWLLVAGVVLAAIAGVVLAAIGAVLSE